MPAGKSTHRSDTLTPRQRDVLYLLAGGSTMRQAACTLGISPRTIAFHKYRIMERFHLYEYRSDPLHDQGTNFAGGMII